MYYVYIYMCIYIYIYILYLLAALHGGVRAVAALDAEGVRAGRTLRAPAAI